MSPVETPAPFAGPLVGVRVVDLTNVIMGPFATHILADMGADVIKVESAEGDSIRTGRPSRSPGMSGNFLHLNRNKRSVVLDLKSEAGMEAMRRLAASADVFVHALRPRAIRKLGLDYESVRAINPDIVHCGAYGFSAAGPYADKAAYDDIIQAGSGFAAFAAERDGAPSYAPTVICDKLAGQAIAYAVIAALFARERGAGGQAVEVPMFETAIEFMLLEHLGGFGFEPALEKPGYRRLLNAWRRPFATADGHCCILPYSDANWRDFLTEAGHAELVSDPRFATLPDRVAHIEVLYEIIDRTAPTRTNAEWVAFCDAASIPCMPVIALEDLPDDPHVKAVGLFATAEHPTEGAYRSIRPPVTFSGAPWTLRRHAPRHGEHTAEVLAELGLGPAARSETAPDAPAPAPDAPAPTPDASATAPAPATRPVPRPVG
ncbi:formyl-CoA transferase [Albimonas donghaensis]|uniref:Formyl-CoA transferase n=1 Tax=Albimonas donghaensis TaxID=356660 RepID=A0A1H2QMJ2_9RHOB|nr:CoA transferase [Albimonas donghaensis]SDW08372.1 formyl-CoA transferase [Albimonas donghaensis]